MSRAAKGKSAWAIVLGLAAGLLAAALPASAIASAEAPSYAETRVWGFELQDPAGVGAEQGLSVDGTRGYGESYDEEAVGYPLVPRGVGALSDLKVDAKTVLSGGRGGGKVKTLVGPPNAAVRGGGQRVFVTNDRGQVILDITGDRVKPVTPGQGFGPKRAPTKQEMDLLNKVLEGGS